MHVLTVFEIEKSDPRKFVSVRMFKWFKWFLSCPGGKGLLKPGVLAFDMSCAGAGVHSKYMMGS